MADIIVNSKKKVNLFDRVIQSVVIMVNMNKMNRAIDEHLNVIHKAENEDKRIYEENILREIVFVKYQYDILQRQMYELKISYPDEIVDKINSSVKTDRLELQKTFLEMEYDRVTKARFRSRDEIKFNLLSISSAIDAVKQNIKDEGKSQRYNQVIKAFEDIDTKIQTNEYTDDLYKELFEMVDEYVGYINDNYDISKLPADERELIEYVIETMIKGIESDMDRHLYEFNLVINICKNSYRYFKIIDKIFEKLQTIYDESLEKDIISLADYIKMFKEIYDLKIKTMVNDVHRTIKTEDEYLEYSKLAATDDIDKLNSFVLSRAIETTKIDKVKEILQENIEENEEEVETEDVEDSVADDEIKSETKVEPEEISSDVIDEIELKISNDNIELKKKKESKEEIEDEKIETLKIKDDETKKKIKKEIKEVKKVDDVLKKNDDRIYKLEIQDDDSVDSVDEEPEIINDEDEKTTEPELETLDKVRVGITKSIRKVGRPRKNPEEATVVETTKKRKTRSAAVAK